MTGSFVLGQGVAYKNGANILGGTGADTIWLNVGTQGNTTIDAGVNSSSSLKDLLKLQGVSNLGITTIDLSQSGDQLTQVNGSANAAVQKGFENLDASAMSGSFGVSVVAGTSTTLINSTGVNDSIDLTLNTAGGLTVDGKGGSDTIYFGTHTSADTVNVDTASQTVTLSGESGDTIAISGGVGSMTVNVATGDNSTVTVGTASTAATLVSAGAIGNQTITVSNGTLTLGAYESGFVASSGPTLTLSAAGTVDLGAVSGNVHASNDVVIGTVSTSSGVASRVLHFVLDTTALKDSISVGTVAVKSDVGTAASFAATSMATLTADYLVSGGLITFTKADGSTAVAQSAATTGYAALVTAIVTDLAGVTALQGHEVVFTVTDSTLSTTNSYVDLVGTSAAHSVVVELVGVTAGGINTSTTYNTGNVHIV
jgi:hypothetical protein